MLFCKLSVLVKEKNTETNEISSKTTAENCYSKKCFRTVIEQNCLGNKLLSKKTTTENCYGKKKKTMLIKSFLKIL